jgi:hypothetical protein
VFTVDEFLSTSARMRKGADRMQFSTKDLLVTVLPKTGVSVGDLAKICLFHTKICTYPTFCHYRTCLFGGTYGCGFVSCGHCSIQFTGGGGGCQLFQSCGGPGGSACDPTYICYASGDPYIIKDLEDLVTLRTELQETLKKLDEVEKGLGSAFSTKAQADVIERGLTDALEQVKRAKKGMR